MFFIFFCVIILANAIADNSLGMAVGMIGALMVIANNIKEK
jgi:hypothetical protein